ncbi:MAG: type I-C CRISPR-associated protein Cas8c/Csd1 [Deltaproteobacteria bacterium]|nr:type I-C CRISPR-associated protein Cas8c/Csd1 [Deltaproteobacteria bacterium]
MIFQSLISLYDRLYETEAVPTYGFSEEDIGFVVTIDKDGSLIGQPEDLRTKTKTNIYTFFPSIVPYSNQVNVRANAAAKTPNFMVDKADYIFGMAGTSEKKVHHEHFEKLIHDVCGNSDDDGIVAVKAFLRKWKPGDSVKLGGWKDICGTHGKWVAFRLQGDTGFIHKRPEVKKLWSEYVAKESYHEGVSFVDGREHPIQPQYAQFKFGSGASLVSFNEKAYESYGKKRGANAPISVEAEFKSATALKFLLRSKTRRFRIADATTVFWTERESALETFMGQILNPSSDGTDAIPVQKFLEAVRAGTMPSEIENDDNVKFYILGLSVNKARLALRFWLVCSVGKMLTRLRRHFNDLEMERNPERDIKFPGIWHLLKETARETKNISPLLGGALTRSILTGANYPQNLYQGVLGRIRASQNINYLKASVLKAVLQRNYKKEVPMALDTERREVSYLLGRLFAVLEKAQLDALGKVNATIKGRFFSAASATPASVFPRLLRLSQHHIEKAKYGYVSDRRISEIMEHINVFPSHLNLQDQGLFAIAYYQQKNAL